jgi:hypothetical protein
LCVGERYALEWAALFIHEIDRAPVDRPKARRAIAMVAVADIAAFMVPKAEIELVALGNTV